MEKDLSFNKENAIIAQNSATAAAAIVSAIINISGEVLPDTIKATFDDIREHIFNGTLALGGTEMVVNAFEAPTSVAEVAYETTGNNVSVNSGGAGATVLKFGKHRGKTIAQVAVEDRGWLDWASQNTNNDFVKNKIREFLSA